MPSEGGGYSKINDPTNMNVWCIFLKIWLFKNFYEKFSSEVWLLKPGPKFFDFLNFINLMSFERDECKQNDDRLPLIRPSFILEIFIFFNLLIHKTLAFFISGEKSVFSEIFILWNPHSTWKRNLSQEYWSQLAWLPDAYFSR